MRFLDLFIRVDLFWERALAGVDSKFIFYGMIKRRNPAGFLKGFNAVFPLRHFLLNNQLAQFFNRQILYGWFIGHGYPSLLDVWYRIPWKTGKDYFGTKDKRLSSL